MRPISAVELVRHTKSYTIEYSEIFRRKEKDKKGTKWRPPPEDMIKFNMDGAFTSGIEHAGWGVVARNSSGMVIHACAGRNDSVHDVFGAELGAMEKAIAFAADLGMLRVIFETDSQLLAEQWTLGELIHHIARLKLVVVRQIP